ncbi:acetoin utilization protein AcuC [Paenibacillus agaridevorans]|uniref:Acetoin utilization protein AcuC n=1 Tax=Paenibacillus agaridevorans TaxID=171404 RepID=A0A2R5EJG9_9BACL|nr:acetoin utilization protein AcuC [Paenibacillus agaridevorans]GBG06235.1 acetoin utilization protein AcuC [Paenibacillus agaridevorans]
MVSNAIFIHHSDSSRYKFNEDHPFDPIRQTLTIDLLKEAGALTDDELLTPSIVCNDELLQLVHRPDYVNAVKALNNEADPRIRAVTAEQYGLMTEDTPFFSGMHEAASLIVAGSVAAADAVMSGQTLHAFHLAGGLHHAFPDKASGFCVYNDAAIAIEYIRERYGARVLYIDTDVHHGDGVQWVFYADPHVCTYSIHETGKYLFPGTGYAAEKGADSGFGTCFNMPLEPFTEDESWLESFNITLRKVIATFKPDIIVSQHGCDAHAYDPLSHIHCSMNIYREIPAIIHELAHTYTGGKWVALGGGGYDIWRVVPRAWSMIWLEMIDHPLASQFRGPDSPLLPQSWIARWKDQSPAPLPTAWLDGADDIPPVPRRAQIVESNRITQGIVTQDL